MLYILITLIAVCLSAFLFSRAAGSLSLVKPNLISYVFYYNILLQTVAAAILTVTYLDSHYVINQVSDNSRFYGWVSVVYLIVTLPMGMLLAKALFIRRASMRLLLGRYTSNEIETVGVNGNALKYSVWVFTVISMLACIYTFYVIGYHPFVKAVNTGGSGIESLRIAVSRDFSGNVYVRNIAALTMMPVLSYVWFFFYFSQKKILDLWMFCISFFFATSILYYNFSKAPLLWYFLSFLFVYFYASGKLKVRYFFLMGGISFVGLVLMYGMAGQSLSDFASYNSGPIGRIILGQASGLFIMLDIFPDTYSHIGFASLSRFISSLLGYEYIDRASRLAMTYFNPDGVEAGTAGVMNSIFIAEAWANFGLVGILIAPFWVGFLIQGLYIFFLTRNKNPVYLAFFVSFSIGGSVTGGFNDYIYNAGFVLQIFLMIMIFGLALVFRQIISSNFRRFNENNFPSPTAT